VLIFLCMGVDTGGVHKTVVKPLLLKAGNVDGRDRAIRLRLGAPLTPPVSGPGKSAGGGIPSNRSVGAEWSFVWAM
jgi:hypothetical protein